jgi:hypothetical protein
MKVLSTKWGVRDLHNGISLTERSDFSDLVGSLVESVPVFILHIFILHHNRIAEI